MLPVKCKSVVYYTKHVELLFTFNYSRLDEILESQDPLSK